MLNLGSETPADWGVAALPHLDEILIEQAHLEKKAAAAALRYLFRYPADVGLHAPLAALAREELEHFAAVLAVLERRGIQFGPQVASPYARRLLGAVRGNEPERLLDTLLCNALIEARSCERMLLLQNALKPIDRELAGLYHELVGSEARHHDLYLGFAVERFGAEGTRARMVELTRHEAAVIAALPPMPRLHAAAV